MSSLIDKARSHPWALALDCRIHRCELSEVGRILRYLLLNETPEGLELLKALKSNLEPFDFFEVLSGALDYDLVDWVKEKVSPEKIVGSLLEKKMNEVYGYMVLAELMPFIGLGDEAEALSRELLERACELSSKIGPEGPAELIRLLANGPLTTLGLNRVARVLAGIKLSECHPCCLEVMVEVLESIALSYPPRSVFENKELMDVFAVIMADVANSAIKIVDSDKEAATRVFRGLSALLSQLRSIANESRAHEWFTQLRSTVIGSLSSLGEKLGLGGEANLLN
uniref:Uncharacterized protein n=1 Tax=Thermogladius calderae TaxID=1200300 RepID=A0A7J3XXW9_9CREN